MGDETESSGSGKPGMKKNVALLALCQALFNSSTGVVLSVSALVGLALASNKSLATLPQALQWEATAAFSIPLALMMRRYGSRAGFVFGAMMGSIGAIVAAIAIFQGSFELYLIAIIFFGAFTISGQTYRFAAVDVADEKWHSVAISLVVGGGVLAAFVGPEISKWTHDVAGLWLGNETFAKAVEFICGPGFVANVTLEAGKNPPYQFASTFIILAFIPIFLIFLVCQVGFPPVQEQKFDNTGRRWAVVIRQPGYITAVLCAVIGWGVMVLMMAATPLAMVREFGHTFEDSAFIAQWHMFGMFAPSFFTGSLIKKCGLLNVLLAGLVLSSTAALIGMSGGTMQHFWFANVCVGCGWNFLFVGSTHLLTKMYHPEEKAKAQGINDFLVFQSVAVFSLSAGLLHNNVGWVNICALLLPCVSIVFIAVLYLKFKPGAAPPGVGGRELLKGAKTEKVG